MVARFHYDEIMLKRYLHDQLDDQQQSDFIEHVETCEHCLAQIDTLSRQGLSWDDVGGMLRDEEPSESPAGPVPLDHCQLVDEVVALLDPTDHAESLGRFARYEILEILGRGGMGIVMRGLDTALDRQCAIKVLSPNLASSAAARKRFSREAKSAAAVVHPHVVPIQTVNEHQGLPFLVMPVIEGQSLQRRVEENGPLSVIETVRIAAQVAEGLASAHAQGLVHRDIKPENILLENDVERVQITDFGLARAIDDASMTRSGIIAGTPQYMSPEQAHGDSIDHRSDLFSLGSVMYFMLTGRSPFRAETTMGVLNRIGHDAPRSLRSINAEVPAWLEAIVVKLHAKAPGDRLQTAEEVFELLNQWLAHLQRPDAVPMPEVEFESTEENSTVSIRLLARLKNTGRWYLIGGLSLLVLTSVIVLLPGEAMLPTVDQPSLEKGPAADQRLGTGSGITPGIVEESGWNANPSLQETFHLLESSDDLSRDAGQPFLNEPDQDTTLPE